MTAGQIISIIFMCIVGFFFLFGMIYSVASDIVESHKKKKQIIKEKVQCVAKMYSSYMNLQIENYILQKNEDKYLKEISRLKNRIKKLNELKGEKK